jgi:hypothetical protein
MPKPIRDLIEFALKERTVFLRADNVELRRLAKLAQAELVIVEKELAGDTEDLVRRSYEAIDRYPPLRKENDLC